MTAATTKNTGHQLYPELREYLAARAAEFDLIPTDRKAELAKVADYVRSRLAGSVPAKLTFVCTHNSRRSHLSQIWAHVAADFYTVKNVQTYSGGTEATALNPRAVAALQRAGLRIAADDPSAENPRYQVKMSDQLPAQECFSKVFDAPPNPTRDYCAVMTCSQADDACPLVMGSDLRMPIRYDDPKIGDDTDQELVLYDERSRQICREMLFLMSSV